MRRMASDRPPVGPPLEAPRGDRSVRKLPNVALVNAAGGTDGVSYDARSFGIALRELGYGLVWYQAIDRGIEPVVQERDRIVPGLGFPLQGVDQGINRLWVFPRRLRTASEEILLLMDPTLVNVARSHPRRVVRVHDLKPLTRYSDRRASSWMFRYAIPRLRDVHRILVPSNAAAAELLPYGIRPERIRVVPETHALGSHPEHIARSIERIRATGTVRVVLVAVDRPHKNLHHLLRMAEASRRASVRGRVEFTILSRLEPETAALVSRLGLPNLTVIPRVPRVADVYEANDVLVHPSLYEGFGRPVIEAMSFGLPVVASRIPPLTEIVGTSGTLLDPGMIEPWLDALYQLTDPGRYEIAARRSFERGQDYSPEQFRAAVGRAFADIG